MPLRRSVARFACSPAAAARGVYIYIYILIGEAGTNGRGATETNTRGEAGGQGRGPLKTIMIACHN